MKKIFLGLVFIVSSFSVCIANNTLEVKYSKDIEIASIDNFQSFSDKELLSSVDENFEILNLKQSNKISVKVIFTPTCYLISCGTVCVSNEIEGDVEDVFDLLELLVCGVWNP